MWDLLSCEKTISLSHIGKIEENDTLSPLQILHSTKNFNYEGGLILICGPTIH